MLGESKTDPSRNPQGISGYARDPLGNSAMPTISHADAGSAAGPLDPASLPRTPFNSDSQGISGYVRGPPKNKSLHVEKQIESELKNRKPLTTVLTGRWGVEDDRRRLREAGAPSSAVTTRPTVDVKREEEQGYKLVRDAGVSMMERARGL